MERGSEDNSVNTGSKSGWKNRYSKVIQQAKRMGNPIPNTPRIASLALGTAEIKINELAGCNMPSFFWNNGQPSKLPF